MKEMANKSKQLEHLRPLDGLEHYFSAFNRLKFYYNSGITGYYHLQPFASVASLESTVFAALAIVIAKHPALCVIPVAEDTPAPRYARLPSFDLQNLVTFVERQTLSGSQGQDRELDALLQTPHNQPFENTSNDTPFWRLMILTNALPGATHTLTASFIYHNAVCDGTSGLVFHKAFLAALNSSLKALRTPIVRPPKVEMLPSLEKLHPFPISCRKYLSLMLSKFASIPRGIWAGAPVTKKGERCFQSQTMSPYITAKLIELCRKHNTTVQTPLQVIVASSLFQILPEKFTRLTCIVPVSLKPWLPHPITEDSMGTWTSTATDSYERGLLSSGFSWPEAWRSKESIERYLEMQGKDDTVGLLRYIKNYDKHCWRQVGKPRVGSFEINNIGVFRAKFQEEMDEERRGRKMVNGEVDCEEWRMGRMVFSQSAGITHAAVCLSVVTGGDGALTLGYAWQEGVVQSEVVDMLVDLVEKGVWELVESGEKALPAIPEQTPQGK